MPPCCIGPWRRWWLTTRQTVAILKRATFFGSGTISGTELGSEGCLLEMTRGGRNPVSLPNGETRTYLADGDEVIFRATARSEGHVSIGFGECRGTVTEAINLG